MMRFTAFLVIVLATANIANLAVAANSLFRLDATTAKESMLDRKALIQRKGNDLVRGLAGGPVVNGWTIPLYGISGVIFDGASCPLSPQSDFTQVGYFECSSLGEMSCALNQGYLFLPNKMPQMFYLTCEEPDSNDAGTPLRIKTWSDNTCTQPLAVFNEATEMEAKNTECMSPLDTLGVLTSMRVVGGRGGVSASIGARFSPFYGYYVNLFQLMFCNTTNNITTCTCDTPVNGGYFQCTGEDLCEGPQTVLGNDYFFRCHVGGIPQTQCQSWALARWTAYSDNKCANPTSVAGVWANGKNSMYANPGECSLSDAKIYFQRMDCFASAASTLYPTATLLLTLLSAIHLLRTS